MTPAHSADTGAIRLLRLSGALRAKGHAVPEDVLAAEWKAVDDAKTAAARRLRAAVEPVLLAAVRDAARRRGPVRVELLGDDLVAVLPEAVTLALRAGFATGLARVSARAPFDAERAVVRQTVARLVALAQSVPETLAARVETVIRDGLAAGLDSDAIGEAIAAAAPEMTAAQAQVVGRTTAGQAFEAGQSEAFREVGVERKRWLTQRDDRVRDEHAALDGEEVGIDEAFSNGEDYPSDINCRCTVLPVMAGKSAPRGRPWLAERNARIVAAYPGLRDTKGREVALCEIGEREGLSPDRVWAIWKARRRAMSAH